MKRFLLLCTLFFGFASLAQQSPEPHPGDVLVQLYPGVSVDELIEDLNKQHAILALRAEATLSRELRMYHLRFNTAVPVEQSIRWVVAHPDVVAAQGNKPVSYRAIPNDLEYVNQWQFNNLINTNADLDAEMAWDISTGGLTSRNDTIVVAVIDDGLDTTHTDFGNNLWVNRFEIPNDSIDNDGNGFIDDYRGWNFYSNNGDIQDGFFGGWHGTPVAGIVGAQGNDGIGVTGVNWNVKLMIIVGGGGEADALAAYGYILNQRRRYNQSQGVDGAYVVSTNASWGIDFGQPANAPLWCNFYDSLGVEGVLSCGATINGNHDVDSVGDLPTACPSDYLISVTNMNDQDQKVFSAGYGDSTIDIGAYGAGTYTAALGNTFGGFGGTSGATPHVTGTLALMYSMACDELIDLVVTDPDSGAYWFRALLFRSAVPNSTLTGLVSTEGKLNMLTALQEVEFFCDSLRTIGLDELGRSGQWQVYPNPATTELSIVPLGTQENTRYRLINALGQTALEGQLQSGAHAVDVRAIGAGWYVLELRADAGVAERRKIVIE